jgi:hypothetical protein
MLYALNLPILNFIHIYAQNSVKILTNPYTWRHWILITSGSRSGCVPWSFLSLDRQPLLIKVWLPRELKEVEGYASLMLTNHDGHLRDNSLEIYTPRALDDVSLNLVTYVLFLGRKASLNPLLYYM